MLFLFLGDRRVTLLAAVSLPVTFLLTFAAMWLLGMELNLVSLTAIIVAVGMLPVALERAIGLERLSPLAIVAIGGLLVSALAVLVVVPTVASLLEDATS